MRPIRPGLGLLAGGPSGARPNQVGDPNTGGLRTQTSWFNTAAFVANTVSTTNAANPVMPGNAGVANILTPGYEVWNLTVAKDIRFRDNQNFQLTG